MPAVQQLLMNNGIHFSMYPVSGFEDIQKICEAQLTGEVGSQKLSRYRPPPPPPFAHKYCQGIGP